MKRILIACALLLFPVAAQAHPCIEGPWTAPLPCPGTATYEFGPSEHIFEGAWRGCLRTYIGGKVGEGRYMVRMLDANVGIVTITEGLQLNSAAGIVDFKARTFTYIGTTYRR